MTGESYFHVGMIVPTLEPALEQLTELFGYSWLPTVDAEVPVHDPATGATSPVRLRFAYSEQEPRLEVIEQAPGTPWALSEGSNLHHLGFFVDDVPAAAERLSGAACPMEVCMDAAGQRPASFSYHRALGARFELVDRSVRQVMFGP